MQFSLIRSPWIRLSLLALLVVFSLLPGLHAVGAEKKLEHRNLPSFSMKKEIMFLVNSDSSKNYRNFDVVQDSIRQ